MSVKREHPGSQKSRPELEALSLEQLEELLAGVAADGVPDVPYMKSIMEVMREKEAGSPDAAQVDTEAALREFHGTAKMYASKLDKHCESDSSHPFVFRRRRASRLSRRFRLLRNAALAAMVFTLCCSAVFALPDNVFQPQFKDGLGTFQMMFHAGQTEAVDQQRSKEEREPFQSFQEAAAAETDLPVTPTYVPEGTQLLELQVTDRSDGTRIIAAYRCTAGEFFLQIQVYNGLPGHDGKVYQKDKNLIQEYITHRISHYFIQNMNNLGVVWLNGNVECEIYGTISLGEMQRMIDSIYMG